MQNEALLWVTAALVAAFGSWVLFDAQRAWFEWNMASARARRAVGATVASP